MIGFSLTTAPVEQLVAKSVPAEDPETYFYETKVIHLEEDGKKERIYICLPLSFAEQDLFVLQDMSVNITDFGCGSSIFDVG